MGSTKCTATTASNRPCKAWAVHNTDPPRCAAHGGAARSPGAPAGNRNAVSHGTYCAPSSAPADLPAAIAGLEERIEHLADYIDDPERALSIKDYLALVRLQGELTSRLGRLLQIWDGLASEDAGELTGAINEALDMISDAWSLPL